MRPVIQYLQLAFLVSCFLAPGELAAASHSKLYAWYVESNNMDVPLEHANEYSVNAFFIQVVPDWNTVCEDLSFHDRFSKIAKRGAAHERAEKVRAELRSKISKARQKGLEIYLMVGELDYPQDLFEKYPEMRDPDQSAFWDFVGSRVEEVLAALPELSGLIIYLDETPHKIYDLPGSQPVERYISRLLTTYLRICAPRNKQVLVSTFTNYYPERLEALIRAIRTIPLSEQFAVLNWVCPSDWGLFRVINPAIGRVGGHPEILNFDFSGENWGEGLVPLAQLDFIAERLRAAEARGGRVAGLSGFVNWWIPQNLFGGPSEVNLFGAPRLLENLGLDPAKIYDEWLARRYGKEAAPLLLSAFQKSFRVVTSSRQVLGLWALEYPKSEFAPAYWIDYSLRANSPAVWDENFRSVEGVLFNPDERVLEDVLREKDQAIGDAEAAVEAVEAARKFLSPSDYEALHRPFRRARDEAHVLRPYFELYFRYKMWARDHQPSRLGRMRDLQDQLRNWANFFENNYSNDPLHTALRIREYIDEMRGLLAGKPLRQVVVTW